MSEQLWGQDVEQVRELSRTFERSAQNLESSRQLIDGVVFGFDGWGPNVEQMRDLWSGDLAPSLTDAADALRDAGDKAARNADDQQDTTDSYGGSAFAGATAAGSAPVGDPFAGVTGTISGEADGGGGLTDWFGDRLDDAGNGLDWLGGQASDGANWVGDQAADLGDWFSDTASDVGGWAADTGATYADSFGDLWDTGGQFWDATGGSVLDGRWPRTTEVVASNVLFAGSVVDHLVTNATFGQVDLNVFDDGEPYADPPRPVDLESDAGRYPQNIEDVIWSISDAYSAGDSEVRVTTIETPDGPRVIVSVPGTQEWDPRTGDSPMDLTGNLVTAGGGTSTMTEAVELAMQNADIPPGAEVMIAGHSQGGMTAADLASDPGFVSEYNVTNLITIGSPIDSNHIDPGVNVLELQHEYDVVPRLDMGDGLLNPLGPLHPSLPSGYEQAGPNHTGATLENPPNPFDLFGGNHSHQEYGNSLRDATTPGDPTYNPSLAAYEQELRNSGFLGENDASNTSAVDIHVGRNH